MNCWMIIIKQMDEGMNKSINEQISCDREMNKESTRIKHERKNERLRETKGKNALGVEWIKQKSSTTKSTIILTNKLKHFTYTS